MAFLRLVLCATLTGLAIKAMDDYLDVSEDALSRQPNLVSSFGSAVVPYAMMSLAVAAMIDCITALSLFAAAYVVGMVKDQGQVYPLGSRPAVESICVVVLSSWLMGVRPVVASIVVLLLVQVVDDIADAGRDGGPQRRNLVEMFGLPECAAAAILLCIASAAIDVQLLLACLLSVALLEGSLKLLHRATVHTGSRG